MAQLKNTTITGVATQTQAATLDEHLARKGEVDAAVAQKATLGHTHVVEDITDLEDELAVQMQEVLATSRDLEWASDGAGHLSGTVRRKPGGGILSEGDGLYLDGEAVNALVTAATTHDPVTAGASDSVSVTLTGQQITVAARLEAGGGLEVGGSGIRVRLGTLTNEAARGDHTHDSLHAPVTASGDLTLILAAGADQQISGTVRLDATPDANYGRLATGLRGICVALGTGADVAAAGNHGHDPATTSADGFMSKAHVDRLTALDTGTGILTRLLDGYVASSGDVAATDTILAAFGKLAGRVARSGDTMTGKLAFSGTDTPGLILKSMSTAEIGALNDTNFDGGLVWNWETQRLTWYYRSVPAPGYAALVRDLCTLNVPEDTNLYYTDARVRGCALTGFVSGSGNVAATDTLLEAIQKLDGRAARTGDTLSGALQFSGTTHFGLRLLNLTQAQVDAIGIETPGWLVFNSTVGRVQWTEGSEWMSVPLNTTELAEGTNLYYTDARARACACTGFTSGTGAVVGTDTLLAAIGRLDGRAYRAGDTFTRMIQFSGTTHAGVKLNSLTTTQKNALSAAAGMQVYDTTLQAACIYNGSSWVTLGAGGSGVDVLEVQVFS